MLAVIFMERLRISRSLEAGKYVMLVIGLVLITVLFFLNEDTNTLITCAIFLVISGVLYYLFSNAKTVEFDEVNMFISNKKGNEVIPLTNIFRIKLTMTQINNDNFWKIKYTGEQGEKLAVRILPKRDTFEVFKRVVREKSPSVEIKNWSHSFDLDQ